MENELLLYKRFNPLNKYGYNTIGGSASGAANVLSGNGKDGISLHLYDVLQGNLIGTDATGNNALSNAGNGVDTWQDVTIGGTTSGSRNVISANTKIGINISSASLTGDLIEGNNIGTNLGGTTVLGNSEGIFDRNCLAGQERLYTTKSS